MAAALFSEEDVHSQDLALADGVRVGCFSVQPAQLIEEVEFGDRTWVDGELPDVDGQPVEAFPCGLICFRTPQGQVETVEVAIEDAEILVRGENLQAITPSVLHALIDMGIVVRTRWDL
jgi:hypothetical protein